MNEKQYHLRNAEIKQIIQGEPGGLFSRGIGSKVLIHSDSGDIAVPYKPGISVFSGCTMLRLWEEWNGDTGGSCAIDTIVKTYPCSLIHSESDLLFYEVPNSLE